MTTVEDLVPRRYEAAQKVTGAARYEGEVRAPGMVHAALVTAPLPSARVLGIDSTQARALAGCVDVLTHENAPKIPPAAFLALLQEPVVHFAGQPVALVLAETPQAARAAAASVEVRYAPMPAITALDQARETAFAPRTAGLTATDSRRGEPEAALAAAAVALDRRYTTPTHNHLAIEPQVVLADWDGSQLTVHTPSQAVFAHRTGLAKCFGLDVARVRVISLISAAASARRAARGSLSGAGLPGGKTARPPGAAGAHPRADVHPGRPAAGDGAAAANRRRARRAYRRPPARHRGADLDLRRVRRSGGHADAHDVRLRQRRHHAPPGAGERTAAQPGAGARRRAGQLRAGIGAGRAGP